LYIHTNGYVFFNSKSSGIRISALRYVLSTTYGGGIYYQNLNSQSSDFNSIKSDLNRLNSNFVPTILFRIKYDNVPDIEYDNERAVYAPGSLIASFQIVLASDATKSYVLLKYTSCLSDATLNETPGLYYLSLIGQLMSNTISSPCSNSNVNQTGTWVFDVSPVDSKRILTNELFYFFIII
jgi:hypothetical protein